METPLNYREVIKRHNRKIPKFMRDTEAAREVLQLFFTCGQMAAIMLNSDTSENMEDPMLIKKNLLDLLRDVTDVALGNITHIDTCIEVMESNPHYRDPTCPACKSLIMAEKALAPPRKAL